jgi:hypothetical protein
MLILFNFVDLLLGKVGTDISLKLADDKLPVKEGQLAYLHFFAWKQGLATRTSHMIRQFQVFWSETGIRIRFVTMVGSGLSMLIRHEITIMQFYIR